MAVESSPAFLQANTYSAEVTRRAVNVSWQRNSSGNIGSVAGGVFGIGSDLVMSAPASGMTVNNATGEALVPGTSSTTQSGYYFRGSSTTNTSVAASNPTNPRIDLVCATVNDAGYVGSLNTGVIQVVTGTPTSGATLANLSGAPALPTSSLLIGYILVPANATSIITADLSATTVTPVAYSAQNIFNAVAVSASTAISAVSGSHYIVSATSPTITLPVPFKNARVKVTNYGSGVPVVSHNASEVIYGLGCGSSGQTTISLGAYGATATLESDRTSWYITAGAQDTGWLAMSNIPGGLLNSWANAAGPAAGGTIPGYRKIGNVVRLGGYFSGGSTNTNVVALPVGFRPTYALALPGGTTSGSNSFAFWGISTAGVIIAEYVTGTVPSVDGITFTVD